MKKENYKDYVQRIVFPCVLYAIVVGIVVGIVVFFFKFVAVSISEFSVEIYSFIREHLIYVPIFLIVLIFLGLALASLQYLVPESSGGGIPRSEGIARDLLVIKPIRISISTIIGSCITFLAGLPLGNEGPSIIIGTSLGVKFNEIFKTRGHSWRQPVVSSGVSSAFAVVTGLPFTGIVFSFEEVFEKYSWTLILASSIGVIIATIIDNLLSQLLNFKYTLINFTNIVDLKLSLIWIPVVIGLVSGLIAIAFFYLIKFFMHVYGNKLKFKSKKSLIFALLFLLTGIFGLLLSETIGSGHDLINVLLKKENLMFYILAILIIYKIITISLCVSSGVTGGIFVPILTIGALIGAVLAKILIYFGLPDMYYQTIIALSICAFLGSSLHCPMTAVIFVMEITKIAFVSTVFSLVSVFVALFLVAIFNVPSINQLILDQIIIKEPNSLRNTKVIEESEYL
jgi:H+/Cl- antiporter ClcA